MDGVEAVGTVCDGAEAVRLAEARHPDVILMDLRMPGTDGIAATAALSRRLPTARVLVLTTYVEESAILPALRAGARGYPAKDASAEQIEAAIRAVAHELSTHPEYWIQIQYSRSVDTRDHTVRICPSPRLPEGPHQQTQARSRVRQIG